MKYALLLLALAGCEVQSVKPAPKREAVEPSEVKKLAKSEIDAFIRTAMDKQREQDRAFWEKLSAMTPAGDSDKDLANLKQDVLTLKTAKAAPAKPDPPKAAAHTGYSGVIVHTADTSWTCPPCNDYHDKFDVANKDGHWSVGSGPEFQFWMKYEKDNESGVTKDNGESYKYPFFELFVNGKRERYWEGFDGQWSSFWKIVRMHPDSPYSQFSRKPNGTGTMWPPKAPPATSATIPLREGVAPGTKLTGIHLHPPAKIEIDQEDGPINSKGDIHFMWPDDDANRSRSSSASYSEPNSSVVSYEMPVYAAPDCSRGGQNCVMPTYYAPAQPTVSMSMPSFGFGMSMPSMNAGFGFGGCRNGSCGPGGCQ